MRSFAEMLEGSRSGDLTFPEVVLRIEEKKTGLSADGLREGLRGRLRDMEHSASDAEANRPHGHLTGDEAGRMNSYLEEKNPLSGDLVGEACRLALGVSSCNAAMGRIVAAPTAGSCGILPGLLFAFRDHRGATEEDLTDALVVASGIGAVIAARATLAGAEGGCQAECGAAAAMGAASLAWLSGGSDEAILHAAALTLKSIMGLVCDPVAGLVEVPCIKRNGSLVALAAVCADMALAGIRSVIPPDEVVDAMGAVGRALPDSLRETARGGVAVSPTGREIHADIRSRTPSLEEIPGCRKDKER